MLRSVTAPIGCLPPTIWNPEMNLLRALLMANVSIAGPSSLSSLISSCISGSRVLPSTTTGSPANRRITDRGSFTSERAVMPLAPSMT